MQRNQRGFTLIELITVVILISIISVTAMSRFNSWDTSKIQAGRDYLIAACFFAQQTAMARSTGSNIALVITSNTISVTESNSPLSLGVQTYPLNLPAGVSATPATLQYDRLGRTADATARTITLSKSGISTTVVIEVSGYAH